MLDERTLVYPEQRGDGVYASPGNLAENPHVGLLFVDFFTDLIGLHINGEATAIEYVDLLVDERVSVALLEVLSGGVAAGRGVGSACGCTRRTSIAPSTFPGWPRWTNGSTGALMT